MSEPLAYDARWRMARAGIPHEVAFADSPEANYLAAMFSARVKGEKLSVTSACRMAGTTPAAIRKRRERDPIFAAAERTSRFGEAYAVVHEPEPTDPDPEPLPEPRTLDEWLDRQGVFS
jgi:hypothetical protein